MKPRMTTTPAALLNFRRLGLIQLGVSTFGSLVFGFWLGFEQGASFGAGAYLMFGNLLGLAWAWWRVIAQKTVALTVLIIVIKYAVLLSAIFYLARSPGFSVTFAGLGITSLLVSALIWALTTKNEKEN